VNRRVLNVSVVAQNKNGVAKNRDAVLFMQKP